MPVNEAPPVLGKFEGSRLTAERMDNDRAQAAGPRIADSHKASAVLETGLDGRPAH